MDKVFPIFLVIVVAGAALFVWQSGLLGKLGSFTLKAPDFSFLTPRVTSTTVQGGSGSDITPSGSGVGNPIGAPPLSIEIATSEIPVGYTRAQLSPYFKKISISSAYPSNGYPGSYGQMMLYSSLGTGESLNITGWQLKGNRGNQYIPQAVNVYDPTGLAGETDIFFSQGSSLTIYSTASPIGGNLRLNKCIGYLQIPAKFNPPLPANCPPPYLETSINSFSGVCQNYIRSLGACQLPQANPPIPQNDYGCQDFINSINYKGCFDRHRVDTDFLGNQWLIWTNSSFLDQYHDQLRLLDRQGLLVNLYSY